MAAAVGDCCHGGHAPISDSRLPTTGATVKITLSRSTACATGERVASSKAVARNIIAEEAREDDHVSAETRTALLQKKSEGIARVEVDAREPRQTAAAKNEPCVRGDLFAAFDERKA